MANYIKATNFAIKDTLTTGDPAKVVKGTEIDTEFTAIASAVASKRDTATAVALASEVSGTLPIANGGTGQTSASAAINALVPSQSGNSGKVLSTNGTAVSWIAASGNVAGPGSSTDNGIVLFNGTSGSTLKDAASSDGYIHGIRIGRGAGSVSTNTVVGANVALSNNTTGDNNTAVGNAAGYFNTTGSNNTYLGTQAGVYNTEGDDNTAVGYQSMVGASGGSTPLRCVAVGRIALAGISTGFNNTAVGYQSAVSLTTGYNNATFGYAAGGAITTGYNNTFIGDFSGGGNYINSATLGRSAQVTGDNQVQLGDSSTTTYVYGTVQNRSDARDKADVRDTQLGLNFIKALRPVDYKWDMRDDYKPAPPDRNNYETDEAFQEALTQWNSINISTITHDGTHKRTRYHHGLVAQEVKQVLDAQGIDFGGYQDHSINGGADVLSIGYDELIAPLIKSVQELTARLEAAEATIQQLQGN